MAECDVLGDERQPVSAVHLERGTVGSIAIAGRGARTPVEQGHLPEEPPRLDGRHDQLLSVTRPRTRMNAPHPTGDDDVELGREVAREVDVLPRWIDHSEEMSAT